MTRQRDNGRRRVAITGLGVVSPTASGTARFWESLVAGRSGIGLIGNWDASRHRVRIAGEVGDFSPDEWLDVKSVKRLDRFCHFALAAAQMAVDEARFDPADPTEVAVVYSSGIGGAETLERGFMNYLNRGPDRTDPLFVPSSITNMASAQISMRFGYGGPSTCPVTACASSADAIGWGYRLVRDGYASACLAGGAEACVRPAVIAGFQNILALSTRNDDPEGACRPFEKNRDGFVLSEGAGAVLMEPLEAARARGATIYAEICGYGQSTDAFHETAPQPDGVSTARAIKAALREAEVTRSEVDYVNAHGTGTPKADVTETRALRCALDGDASRVAVSSTKSMTGHLLGAAGAVETVATALAVYHRLAPPTINLDEPDPECDLDFVPHRARDREIRVALSNAMGFGGHNVALAFAADGYRE